MIKKNRIVKHMKLPMKDIVDIVSEYYITSELKA